MKAFLEVIPVQTIQYHYEFTLPEIMCNRPSAPRSVPLKNHLSASAIRSQKVSSDEITSKIESCSEDFQSAHVANLKVHQTISPRFHLVSQDVLSKEPDTAKKE